MTTHLRSQKRIEAVMSSKTRTRTTRTRTTRTRTTRSTASTTGSARPLPSVPDRTVAAKVRTDTEDKLWEAMHANPDSTAAYLSVAGKIGKSTAQKILVKWEAERSVTRVVTRVGFGEGGRRAADRWAITEVDPAQDTSPADDVDTTDTAQAEPDAPAAVVVVPDAPDTNDATPAEGDSAELTVVEPTDVQDPVDIEATHPWRPSLSSRRASPQTTARRRRGRDDGGGADAMGGKMVRLAPGSLRGMVEDYLRDHPGEEFGPTAIANALDGKSSGAVSNALDKLVNDGTAVRTKDKPRRFALAPTQQTAAPAPTN
jgi:hypothetical protein